MSQEEETNLDRVEVEVGTWELGLDDAVPEPEHWGAVSDVRRFGGTSTTGKLETEIVMGTGYLGPRVPAFGERTGVVIVRIDSCFDGVEGAEDVVVAHVRLEPVKTTNRRAGSVTVLDDVSYWIAFQVLAVGLLDLSGGENALEPVKTIVGVVELGGRVTSRVHSRHELAGLNFGAWNINS